MPFFVRRVDQLQAWHSTSPPPVSSLELIPLPLSVRTCRCGRLLDPFGHHRASCSRAGVFGRRGFALESAAARICREGGARVTVNMLVRDMDLLVPNARDARKMEIVVDGLPLFDGVRLTATVPRTEAQRTLTGPSLHLLDTRRRQHIPS